MERSAVPMSHQAFLDVISPPESEPELAKVGAEESTR